MTIAAFTQEEWKAEETRRLRISDYAAVDELCRKLKIHPARLRGDNRAPEVVDKRRRIAVELHDLGWSFPRIGRAMNKHHTSVMAMCAAEDANGVARRSAA